MMKDEGWGIENKERGMRNKRMRNEGWKIRDKEG